MFGWWREMREEASGWWMWREESNRRMDGFDAAAAEACVSRDSLWNEVRYRPVRVKEGLRAVAAEAEHGRENMCVQHALDRQAPEVREFVESVRWARMILDAELREEDERGEARSG